MKRILFFVLLGICAYVTFILVRNDMQQERTAQALIANTEYPTVVPTIAPTETPIPSPTIGYQDTAIVAQQTAMEAVRVNAQITAEHEQLILSQLQLTAAVESQHFAMQSWTATAAATSIPLTATQQAFSNTQIANNQSIIAGQLTSTHEAPTQYAALVLIETNKNFAKVDRVFRIGFLIVIAIFLLSISVFVWRFNPSQVIRQDLSEEQEGTPITLHHDRGQGFGSTEKLVVPCSTEQLTELAELAVNGEKRFGINRLERDSRTFRSQRDTLIAVREFLVMNGLAIKADDGLVTLNSDGEEFLSQWFESHQLPTEYEFAEVEQ